MKRREFLKTGIGGAGLFAIGNRAGASIPQKEDIRGLFQAQDEAVMRLAETVYQKCVLGKVFPPEGTLRRQWIGPGGGYVGQWIWDTMFVVDLLSILPGQQQVIRDVFQNYWDFQVSWNAKTPDYAHDMIPCFIKPSHKEWLFYPAMAQIPIIAWGLERVYSRNGDRELLKQSLKHVEKFHEWYWRERDVTDGGLIAVGSYDGSAKHARCETFDLECNMDEMKMTRHPTRKSEKEGPWRGNIFEPSWRDRKGEKEGPWYGDICIPGNTSYLVMGEKSLVRLAEAAGDKEMAARRQVRIDKSVEAMRTHMWDEEAGTFLSVHRDTLEKVPVATIGSWIPLTAGIPTEAMARRMAETLRTPSWQTPLPVPTVDRKAKQWRSDDFWRGDVWPATNYQIASGLADYGYKDLAADIADKTVANAIKNGISERYDAISGKALGVEYLGMTCTLVTMMLDRLCRKHRLEIRGSS